MDADALRAACLAMAGAAETFPFNPETSVFKVGGKMFALSALDSSALSVSLKCDPELAERLRAQYPAITAGYHLNKRHWNTVLLDGSVPDELVFDMIEDSYDLVRSSLPAAQRRQLDGSQSESRSESQSKSRSESQSERG